MRAGILDRRIELQSFAIGTDGDPMGGQWNTEHAVWAERLETNQARSVVSDQVLNEAERIYRIRYRPDIDPTWRVKDGGEFWTIIGTPEGEGRRTETLVLCDRFVPNEREYE